MKRSIVGTLVIGLLLTNYFVAMGKRSPILATNNGSIMVTSQANGGPGSLRQALLDVPPGGTILFSATTFPSNSPATIFLSSPLPTLNKNNITIDASNVGVILDGTSAGANANGFVIQADGNTIRGFTIQNFSNSGVFIASGAENNTVGGERTVGSGPSGRGNTIGRNSGDGIGIWGNNNLVLGNYIGIGISGQFDWGNSFNGVAIWQGASGNTVGGTMNGLRNVISGNDNNGVWIGQNGTNDNVVIGNYIGVTAAGTGTVPNSLSGVAIQDGAQDNFIGNAASGGGNVISGNANNGIYISDAGTSGNQILGNIIGLNWQGVGAIGQGLNGVEISNAGNNNIGNGTDNGRNIISGSSFDGIRISGANATNNFVQGNYIGSNLTGMISRPNGLHGIELASGAHNNQIGGNRLTGKGNLLSGNSNHGLVITENAHHNIIYGNLIGPDVTGKLTLGGQPFGGIDIANGAHDNTIGGTNTGQGNIISGNQSDGIALFGAGTTDNLVIGNMIGVNINGSPLPNIRGSAGGGHGILVTDGAHRSVIQQNNISYNEAEGIFNGLGANETHIEANIISFNGSEGVKVEGAGCSGIEITQNSIHTHTVMTHTVKGIVYSCFTAPNLTASSLTMVTGTTAPNARVEFFSDDYNEGRVYEGFTVADSLGNFAFSQPSGFTGPNVTATSTTVTNNTSEFSQPLHLEWSVVLYLNGDNDLHGYMDEVVNSIVDSDPSPVANVLILLDGPELNDTIAYDLTYSQFVTITSAFTSSLELNMGDGNTLSQFVNWGRELYPVNHIMLSIVDHGGGWAPSNTIVPSGSLPLNPRLWLAGGSGLSWDFSSEYDFLSSSEIERAMENINLAGGPVDVVFYDVCLMGMMEVAYQIKDHASYFVSSQNIGWAPSGDNNRYVQLIRDLSPDATPQDVATQLVSAYEAGLPVVRHPFTLSAVDLSQMDTLATAINQLGAAIDQTISISPDLLPLFNAYNPTQKVDYDSDLFIEPDREGFVDLYDLALNLSQQYTAPNVLSAIEVVTTTLNSAIVAEAHYSDTPWFADDGRVWDLDNAHGLSIYLPLGEDLEYQVMITETSPISPNVTISRNLRMRDIYSPEELLFVDNVPAWDSLIDTYYELVLTPVITFSPESPVVGLQEVDITPPQTMVTTSVVSESDGFVTILWSSIDSQNDVVSGTLLYKHVSSETWINSGLTQMGSSGEFNFPLACGRIEYAVIAEDDVHNVELIHNKNVSFSEATCYIHLPFIH